MKLHLAHGSPVHSALIQQVFSSGCCCPVVPLSLVLLVVAQIKQSLLVGCVACSFFLSFSGAGDASVLLEDSVRLLGGVAGVTPN